MTDLAVAPARRYPFAMPYGWFQVCYPDDLAVGETKALYYFAPTWSPGATRPARRT